MVLNSRPSAQNEASLRLLRIAISLVRECQFLARGPLHQSETLFSLLFLNFSSVSYNMEGKIISVGPWGLEEGTPFCQKNDGILRKIVLIYDGGFKTLTAKYSTSNTHECCDSTELSKNLQKTLVESPKSSNIIKNADFSEGMNFWRRNSYKCQAEVVSSGDYNYAIVSRRGEFWHSIEQDITEHVYVGSIYEVSAHVSVKGGGDKKFEMGATFKIENLDASIYFLHVPRVEVTHLQWARLEGSFSLNTVAKSVSFYLEGPCGGVDLLIRHVSISPVFKKFVIKLEHPDEYLNGISGYYRKLQQGMSEVISSLTFKSNLGTYGPYGTEEGNFFSFKTADAVVIGFHGTSDNYLKSIGLYIKPLQSTKPLLSKDHSMLVPSSRSDSYGMKSRWSNSMDPSSSSQPEFDYSFKLVMIGDPGVGKTSLLLRFTSDSFDLFSTVGVDFKVKMVTTGGKKLKLAIWDTAGQERFSTFMCSYFRGAHGIIMVYDVTRRDTLTNLSDVWAKEIDLYSTNQDCIKMLVGNKVDKESERSVLKEEGIDFARKHGCSFLECSAKTRVNVEQCFEELVLKTLKTPSLLAEGSAALKENIFQEKPPPADASSSSCC